MLKIKDNVDLKELEQFGFVIESYPTPVGQITCYTYKSGTRNVIRINAYSREIIITQSYAYLGVDVLFELICNDLVERV